MRGEAVANGDAVELTSQAAEAVVVRRGEEKAVVIIRQGLEEDGEGVAIGRDAGSGHEWVETESGGGKGEPGVGPHETVPVEGKPEYVWRW